MIYIAVSDSIILKFESVFLAHSKHLFFPQELVVINTTTGQVTRLTNSEWFYYCILKYQSHRHPHPQYDSPHTNHYITTLKYCKFA